MKKPVLLAVAATALLATSAAHALIADCDPDAQYCGGYRPPPPPPPSNAIYWVEPWDASQSTDPNTACAKFGTTYFTKGSSIYQAASKSCLVYLDGVYYKSWPLTIATARVGPIYIFGTHNTKFTLLAIDKDSAALCSPNFTNCRGAFGLEALARAQQMQVAQLAKWDRSGVFGINATEMIACFQNYDGPSSAYFTCQTAPRGSDATLNADITALAWRAYGGAGLVPQSADRAYALYAKRKTATAYAMTYSAVPPDRMRALEYEVGPGDTVGGDGGGSFDGGYGGYDSGAVADIEFEQVNVTGKRPPETPVPGVVVVPNVEFVGNTGLPRNPEIILNPCVTFQVCATPPPPPPPAEPAPPPKVCSPQCNAQASLMVATCTSTALQLTSAFAVLAPGAGIVFGVATADLPLGLLVFRSVSVIGAASTGGYAAMCLGLNAGYQKTCLEKAIANGC